MGNTFEEQADSKPKRLHYLDWLQVLAVLGVFVCWAFITLYRQLTEQRHKRNLAKALARSTSPARCWAGRTSR